MSPGNDGIPVTIEFGGGAELLFDKKKKHQVNLPGREWTVQMLLLWIKDNLLKERPELFLQGDTVARVITNCVQVTRYFSYLRCTEDSQKNGEQWRQPTKRNRLQHDVSRFLGKKVNKNVLLFFVSRHVVCTRVQCQRIKCSFARRTSGTFHVTTIILRLTLWLFSKDPRIIALLFFTCSSFPAT